VRIVLDFSFLGMMAKRVNVVHEDMKGMVLTEDRAIELLADPIHPEVNFVFGPINISQNAIYSLWRIVQKWGSLSND